MIAADWSGIVGFCLVLFGWLAVVAVDAAHAGPRLVLAVPALGMALLVLAWLLADDGSS